MNDSQLLQAIRSALGQSIDTDFPQASEGLLSLLGYRSELRLLEQSGRVEDFIVLFPAPNQETKSERSFREHVASVRILYQLTNAEIRTDVDQASLFGGQHFSAGNTKSFLFTCVELTASNYPRGKYMQFTREINKRLMVPTVVLFRDSENRITLAFVHRREHMYDPSRDVLGSVSLVREINPCDPHRAHLEILKDLSLKRRIEWMDNNGKARDFEGLLAAWLAALDTQELNKTFYGELFAWYNRAIDIARFPSNQPITVAAEEHVIRLITRLLFVWFIKEKGLVSDALFVESSMRSLLKNYDADEGDSYYRCVLQNLFFATLNTEIDRREFSTETRDSYRNSSLYRYKNEMLDHELLLDLFDKSPFINGGLFECLDEEAGTRNGGSRIDCFSDNPHQRFGFSIPNRLFFAKDGLISLFRRYKFTIEENTPIDQEVALDPELLGRVFENLLAAYNPETRESARRQTGTYYTPRPLVEYMVDESLVECLVGKVAQADSDRSSWQDRLRHLLDYEHAFEDGRSGFDASETAALVRAIAEIKVLDPAVGSGAFPMGVLHKLTLALRRLDYGNTLWETLQREIAVSRASNAFDTDDPIDRKSELAEISTTFERYRDSDFGRKLFLIQNSIYGVDIQSIACQIAKLRFFISLAIEQEPNSNRSENYGIRPLPNLETRFVAADSLSRLSKPPQLTLAHTAKVLSIETALAGNREQHFHATSRRQKEVCRLADKSLRARLASALEDAQFDPMDASQIAHWDPYDQNTVATWFDAEYMFGIHGGFDVVLGNPPYIQLQRNGGQMANRYMHSGYETFVRTGDIYQLFYERACTLLTSGTGVLCYITSNSWMKAEYAKRLRKYFASMHSVVRLIEMGRGVFDNAIVDTSVVLIREGHSGSMRRLFPAADMTRLDHSAFPPRRSRWGTISVESNSPWIILSKKDRSIVEKMHSAGKPLKNWQVKINRGLTIGYNPAYLIDSFTRDRLVDEDPNCLSIIKPVLRGRDVHRYSVEWNGDWLLDVHNGFADTAAIDADQFPSVKNHLDRFYGILVERRDQGKTPYNLRSCAFYEDFSREKLFWRRVSSEGRVAYNDEEMFCNNAIFMMSGEALKFLCAVLNSKLVSWFMRRTLPTSGTGTFHWEKVHVERVPIPDLSEREQRPFVRLVDEILMRKAAHSNAEIASLESELDELVYGCLGLDSAETAIIGSGSG